MALRWSEAGDLGVFLRLADSSGESEAVWRYGGCLRGAYSSHTYLGRVWASRRRPTAAEYALAGRIPSSTAFDAQQGDHEGIASVPVYRRAR